MVFSKFGFTSVEAVERSLFRWVFLKRYRLVFLLFIVSVLVAAGFAPYINLILNPYLVVLIFLIFTPFVLDLDPKIFFVVGIVCFFPAALLWFTGQIEEAEVLVEYVFVILLSGSFKAFLLP